MASRYLFYLNFYLKYRFYYILLKYEFLWFLFVELFIEIKMFIEVFFKDMIIICVGRFFVLRFMYF